MKINNFNIKVRMVRENNQKFLNFNKGEDEPKFGAGSAFGKDMKVLMLKIYSKRVFKIYVS